MYPKTNNKMSVLRKLARSLRESASYTRTHKKRLREAKDAENEEGQDSLDAQVDKYLANFETEAKNVQTEGRDFYMLTRRILSEAEDDEEGGEEEEEDTEEESEDEGGDEEEGDEGEDEETPEEPEKLTLEDLDIKSYTSGVIRLIDNYDTLLEVHNTLLRRATNFLVKSYDAATVEAFKAELLESYGLEIGVSDEERKDDLEFQPPKAGAAGPMGGSA